MEIQFDSNDAQLNNFSNNAKNTLKKQIEDYTNYVIKEANLIEEGLREDEAKNEITSSYVIQACRKSKTTRSRNRRAKLIWSKIISTFSSFLCGILFDISAFQLSTLRLVGFLACFIVMSISTVLLFVWEGGE